MYTDKKIVSEIRKGRLKIVPFYRKQLGTNSYDCLLGKWLLVYLPKDKRMAELLKKIVTNKVDPIQLEKDWSRILEGYLEKQIPFKQLKRWFRQNHLNPETIFIPPSQQLKDSFLLDASEDNPTYKFRIPETGLILYPGIGYLGVTVEYTESRGCVPSIDGKSSIGRLFWKVHETAGIGDEGFCGHWTLEMTVVHPLRVYRNKKVAQLTYDPIEGKVSVSYADKTSAKYSNQPDIPVSSQNFKNK